MGIEEVLSMIRKAEKWNHYINYKEQPLKYEFSMDCDGMYICEPYKTRMLKHWKFSTLPAAEESAKKILQIFKEYVAEGDFVGADLARKYLLAGSTKPAVPQKCRDKFKLAYDEAMLDLEYFTLIEDFEKAKQRIETVKREKCEKG
jgi:hypothetical protein